MPPPAFLLALTNPGEAVPESEFHDWYENEHIALRRKVPAFLNWTRWVAADGKQPAWAASYDISSYEDTQIPPYSSLAETRSEREKTILKKVEVLDRRIYELYEGSPIYPPSSLFDEKKAAPYMLFVSMDVKPEAVEEWNKWYDEEHIPMLAKCPGWIRSRRFLLKEAGEVGTAAQNEKSPPMFLAAHEWANLGAFESEEYKQATSTPWRDRVLQDVVGYERRLFEFYKSWERE